VIKTNLSEAEASKMKCPKCQFENREGAGFCSECGHKFELICSNCKATIRAESKFCDACGYDLRKIQEAPPIDYNQPQSYTPKHLADKILNNRGSIEGERKLVTVLFADVANYTAIAEKLDPEEVHQIMNGCFKILMDEIHRYEGTVNQFTGDGVMALFGAPMAHEDHAQRACHAALAGQKVMREYGQKIKEERGMDFLMRIGLNSGPVVVGTIGDDLRMDYTAAGDTTNIAARLQSLAEPGTVLVSENSHRLTKDFFEFDNLGPVDVKGKSHPVAVFRAVQAKDVRSRIEVSAGRGFTPLVARQAELDQLMAAFAKTKAGHGQIVSLVGEAGVGKSRLGHEFKERLRGEDIILWEANCPSYGQDTPYLPIAQIIKQYSGIEAGDDEVKIRQKVTSA
jgi:class 3 adenylate cyclase